MDIVPTSASYLSSIVDDIEELSYSEVNDNDFDFEMDDFILENVKVHGKFTYLVYLLYILIYNTFMTTSL